MFFLVSMVLPAVPLRNSDTAAAEAAGLARGRLARHGGTPGNTAAQLERALVPVYGVSWIRDVLTSNAVGGTDNIDRGFCLLRGPPDPLGIRQDCRFP